MCLACVAVLAAELLSHTVLLARACPALKVKRLLESGTFLHRAMLVEVLRTLQGFCKSTGIWKHNKWVVARGPTSISCNPNRGTRPPSCLSSARAACCQSPCRCCKEVVAAHAQSGEQCGPMGLCLCIKQALACLSSFVVRLVCPALLCALPVRLCCAPCVSGFVVRLVCPALLCVRLCCAPCVSGFVVCPHTRQSLPGPLVAGCNVTSPMCPQVPAERADLHLQVRRSV